MNMKTGFKALVDKVPTKDCPKFLFDKNEKLYRTDCMPRIVLNQPSASRLFRQRLRLICFCLLLVKVVSRSELIVELDWRILQYLKTIKKSIFGFFCYFSYKFLQSEFSYINDKKYIDITW